MATPNPHDLFIRNLLKNKEEAIPFFQSSLPIEVFENLSWDSLETCSESFIKPDLKEQIADILLKVPLKGHDNDCYIYLLFEHKSYQDQGVYLQLLRYLAEIYNWQWKKNKQLEIVIPFLFYQGEKSWELNQYFSGQFGTFKSIEYFQKYIPDFKLEFLDLTKIDPYKLYQNLILKSSLGMMKSIRKGKDEFLKEFVHVIEILDKIESEPKKLEQYRLIIQYMLQTRDDTVEEVVQFIDEVQYQSLVEEIMTTAERLEKRGELRGELKGKLEGKLETVRLMKAEGIDLSIILRVTKLTESQLKENGLL